LHYESCKTGEPGRRTRQLDVPRMWRHTSRDIYLGIFADRTRPESLPKSIEFPCPTCGASVSVESGDRAAVRRIGSDKKRPFVVQPILIRVQSEACRRLIVQTIKN
jgi:hypothetical protein